MKHKILYLLIILFFISNTLSSQQHNGGIKGIVRNEANEPLPFVTVIIESLKVGTTTDERGHYELSLQEGSYAIKYSFVGYITESREVNIANSVKTIDVMMKTDSKMLDEVIISSKGRDANVKELQMSIQNIDMIQIRKIPSLMGEVDVIKSIQLLPGVHAASEGSSGFSVR